MYANGELVREYPHRCPRCQERMHVIEEAEKLENYGPLKALILPCPQCGAGLMAEPGIYWD